MSGPWSIGIPSVGGPCGNARYNCECGCTVNGKWQPKYPVGCELYTSSKKCNPDTCNYNDVCERLVDRRISEFVRLRQNDLMWCSICNKDVNITINWFYEDSTAPNPYWVCKKCKNRLERITWLEIIN